MKKLAFTPLILFFIICFHVPQCFALPAGDLDWNFIADAKGDFVDGDGDEAYWINPGYSNGLEPFWIDPDGSGGNEPFIIFASNNTNYVDFHMRDYGSPRNAFKVYCNLETSYGVLFVMIGDTTTFAGGWLLEIHLYEAAPTIPAMIAELKYIKDLPDYGVYSTSEIFDIPQDPFELLNGPRDFYVQGGCYASTPGGINDSVYFQITEDAAGTIPIAEFDYMPGAGEPSAESFNAVGLLAQNQISSIPANGETVGFDEVHTSVLPDPTVDDSPIDRSLFLFDVLASVQANDFHIVVQPASIANVDMAGVYSDTYQLDEIYEDAEGVHFDWSLPSGVTPAGGVETFGVTLLDDVQYFDGKLQWTLDGLPVGIPASIWPEWTLEGEQPYAAIRNRELTPVYIDRTAGVAPQPMDIVALEAVNDPPVIVTPGGQVPIETDPDEALTFSFINYPDYGTNIVFYDVYDNPAGTGTPVVRLRTAAVMEGERIVAGSTHVRPGDGSEVVCGDPIPPDFFGPGSDPFDGPISIDPNTSASSGAVTTGTSFGWNEDVILYDPPAPVNWDLLKLKLKSKEPIRVQDVDDDGDFPAESFFDVYVEVDTSTDPEVEVTLGRDPSGQGEALIDTVSPLPTTITFVPCGPVDYDDRTPKTIVGEITMSGSMLNWTRGGCGPCCDEPICFASGGVMPMNFVALDGTGFTGTITQVVAPCIEGDFDGDGDVDLSDFARFAQNWLIGT